MEKTSANIVDIISKNFALKCALGVMLIFAGAQIVIPIKPVHITLHTLATLLIGLTYRPKEAATTFISFIALGLMGLPVFSNFNSGLAYFAGPTGGYQVGMLMAATFMAYLRTYMGAGTLLTCALGQMLIYIPGVAWLATFIGIETAIYKGFFVFIPSGIIKLLVLLGIFKALKK
jgi:biotin transport system substrate-specific component